MKATITEHVRRYIAMKRQLGYAYREPHHMLTSFARFAEDRDETVLRSKTVLGLDIGIQRCVAGPSCHQTTHGARVRVLAACRGSASRGASPRCSRAALSQKATAPSCIAS